MCGKLQQRDVILLRPREVVPLVYNRVHRQFHIFSNANVGGIDAGDVVLAEDDRHRPLGEEGEGGDTMSCSDRPVCGNQGCRASPRSLACTLFFSRFSFILLTCVSPKVDGCNPGVLPLLGVTFCEDHVILHSV